MSLVRRARPDVMDVFRRYFDTEWEDRSWLHVEEFVDEGAMVVRGELPDIDPARDVDISIVDNALRISAERRARTEHKEKDSFRSEFRYGKFVREFALPAGSQESDVTATYKDGTLEVRVPLGEASQPEPRKIEVKRG